MSLQELDQRRPLLERQVTAAQNLKNKTSNQETRNAITERSMSHTHIILFIDLTKAFSTVDHPLLINTLLSGSTAFSLIAH